MQIAKTVTPKGALIYRTLDGDYIARTCFRCDRVLPVDRFKTMTKERKTPSTVCWECHLANLKANYPYTGKQAAHNNKMRRYTKKNTSRTDKRIRMKRDEMYPSGTIVCSECKVEKPFEEYYKKRANPSGLTYKCKSCHRK